MRARDSLLSLSFVAFAGLCPMQAGERGPAPRESRVEIPLASHVERAAAVDAAELVSAPALDAQRRRDRSFDAPASVRRLLELAARDGASDVSAVQVALLRDMAPLLELLPLERVVDVALDARRFELVFDTRGRDAIEIEVPARTRFVLQSEADERDPFRRGRPLPRRSSANTLLVHRNLRFELDDSGVAGVRAGDLEVEKGPFRFDVDVRTETRAPGIARDELGRPWLACDERGEPVKRDGRWVAEAYERWIVFEALGHRVEVGVPSAASLDPADVARASAIPRRSSFSRCQR